MTFVVVMTLYCVCFSEENVMVMIADRLAIALPNEFSLRLGKDRVGRVRFVLEMSLVHEQATANGTPDARWWDLSCRRVFVPSRGMRTHDPRTTEMRGKLTIGYWFAAVNDPPRVPTFQN